MIKLENGRKIWLSSDFHFCHDREFIYKPRGFGSVKEMNAAIIENWNKKVNNEDIAFILGDIMLNDNAKGVQLLKSLRGHLIIITGNHDTAARIDLYKQCWNVEGVVDALAVDYKKHHFFLSHYPSFTGNLEKEALSQMVINLYGHTHQKSNFYNDIPFMYHIGVDSHNCAPVLLDNIINECYAKVEECKDML
jgi:calcineurin-like phosphoesterase family protein